MLKLTRFAFNNALLGVTHSSTVLADNKNPYKVQELKVILYKRTL